jgi:hypothetical protein
MPLVFSSTNGAGCGGAGLAKIRVQKRCHIDFDVLNAAIDYYYDSEKNLFKRPLPLKNNQKWVNIDCSIEGLKRTTTQVELQRLHDIDISDIVFKYDYILMLDILLKTDLVVASLYENGRVWFDGIDYDRYTKKLSYTDKIPLRFQNVVTTSGAYRDRTGESTTLSIKGRTRNEGRLGHFNWSEFDTPLTLPHKVYNLSNNIVFQLTDGSILVW